MSDGIIITSKYPEARCCICRGTIGYGEDINYSRGAPRGQKVRHTECLNLTPAEAAAKAAQVASTEALTRLAAMRQQEEAAAKRDVLRGWMAELATDRQLRQKLRRWLDRYDPPLSVADKASAAEVLATVEDDEDDGSSNVICLVTRAKRWAAAKVRRDGVQPVL